MAYRGASPPLGTRTITAEKSLKITAITMETIKLKDGSLVTLKQEPCQNDCDAYDAALYEGIEATQTKEKKTGGKEETQRAAFTIPPLNLARAERKLTLLMIERVESGGKTVSIDDTWLGSLPGSDYRKLKNKAVELKEKSEEQGNE